MQPIDAYLSNPPPGYALLLSGAWGAGKSFFWTNYADKLKGLTPITISVAGLQTNEELESALFLASIKELASSPFGEAGTVIGKALLRLAKIEPKDIKLKADIAGGKSVVCIDDIERFAGDFQVLFGFIVSLIDASGVHCILIADEHRALKRHRDYEAFKERIVGKTVLVTPSIREFCIQSINSSASQQSREKLMAGLDIIGNGHWHEESTHGALLLDGTRCCRTKSQSRRS